MADKKPAAKKTTKIKRKPKPIPATGGGQAGFLTGPGNGIGRG